MYFGKKSHPADRLEVTLAAGKFFPQRRPTRGGEREGVKKKRTNEKMVLCYLEPNDLEGCVQFTKNRRGGFGGKKTLFVDG